MKASIVIVTAMLALAALLLPSKAVFAQSNILTLPSAKTLGPQGSLYAEFVGIAGFRSEQHGGFYSMLPRVIFAPADNLELGMNFSATRAGSPQPAELQPNIKFSWYNGDRFSIASGAMLYFPVINGQKKYGGDTFAHIYTVLRYQSKISLLGDHSPAISGGIWGLPMRMGGTGSTFGGLLGLEVPITSSLTAAADWTSGNQTHPGFSALSAGLIWQVNDHWTVTGIYSWSNFSRDFDSATFFIGYLF